MLFSLRAQYTPESLRALIETPTDRSQAARTAIEASGGKLINFFGTAGGYQQGVQIIYEVPDASSQQGLTNALIASGALNQINVTRLYTPEETVAGLRSAQAVQKAYEPPAVRRAK